MSYFELFSQILSPCGFSIVILCRFVTLYDACYAIFGAHKPSASRFELPRDLGIALKSPARGHFELFLNIFTDMSPCAWLSHSHIKILGNFVALYDAFTTIFRAYKPSASRFELPRDLGIA